MLNRYDFMDNIENLSKRNSIDKLEKAEKKMEEINYVRNNCEILFRMEAIITTVMCILSAIMKNTLTRFVSTFFVVLLLCTWYYTFFVLFRVPEEKISEIRHWIKIKETKEISRRKK